MKRFSFVLGIVFSFFLPTNGVAQRVEMLCTQTDNSGDITVSWSENSINPKCYQIKLYGNITKNGEYSLLDSFPTSILSYTHTGAAGNANQWFYFVVAEPVLGCNGLPCFSDTLGSIWFVNDNPDRGIVSLEWKHPSVPHFSTQDNNYVILCWKNGLLYNRRQINTIYYVDTTHFCGDSINYQILLPDSRGCDNTSMIRSVFLLDDIPPLTPQLDSVSINPNTQKTELGWNPSASPDAFGYIIYIAGNSNPKPPWFPVDTVFGANNTHYVDLVNDANGSVQRYQIAAIDTCRNSSYMSEPQNTMITNCSVGKCDSAVSVSWNAYYGMPDSLTGYRILASENGGGFYMVDTVPSNKFNYVHTGVNPFSSYTYYVQAYNLKDGYSSSSAKCNAEFNRTESAGYVWLRYVSVINNKDIEISVFVSDTVKYNQLFLFRSDDNGNRFSKINQKTKISGVENYLFIDTNVDVQKNTYLYTVGLTDECGFPFVQSDTANNIVLKTIDSQLDINEIAWTRYDGFKFRLDGYDIYRETQTETIFQLITNLPYSQTTYLENVRDLADQGGKFLYQVVANEDYTNPYGFQDRSFSNIVELSKSPQSYIPNAFTPNGDELNEVFRPVLTYVDAEEYAFSIFDRWGNLIFYTNNITLGWDGTIDGKPAAAGIYQYMLTYRLNETKMYKKQGHVTLIR